MKTDVPGLRSPHVWAVPAVCLLGFVAVWASGSNETLFRALNRLGPLTSDILWASLTILGDTLVAIALAGLLARRRPDILWSLLLAAVFATLWVHGIKPLAAALRPLAVLGPEQVHVIGHALRAGSFPSGHTATAFTLAGVFVLRSVPRGLAGGLLLMAILAGISRSVVGAHWPLDLFAGAFGGWLAAIAGSWLAERWDWGVRPGPARGIRIFFLLCAAALLAVHDTGYPQALWLQWLIGVAATVGLGGVIWREWMGR
ncbi:MAG TPA: phosphatase PAP2 family protein [Thiotrichales bacterium]|nr:phosphatase PAP2 family protein [Thiotrichales bacterium]